VGVIRKPIRGRNIGENYSELIVRTGAGTGAAGHPRLPKRKSRDRYDRDGVPRLAFGCSIEDLHGFALINLDCIVREREQVLYLRSGRRDSNPFTLVTARHSSP
jgi:hypothetical protein